METNIADRVALRWYDEEKQGVAEVHYAQYAQDLRRFVAFLRAEYGDVRGKRVAILARNSYQYVICMYGTVIAGGVAVPLNLGKDWDAISYELGLTEPVCILQDGEFAEREPALAETYGSILKPMDVFAAYEPAEDVTEVEDLSALAFIMFTSGTTGRSKGVMLSQKNLFSAMPAFLDPFDDVKKYMGWNTDEFSSLSALPMFHISAMTSLVSWSITGHSINLCNNLKYFYRDLGAMHSEVMAVVPVLLKSIYSDVMKGKFQEVSSPQERHDYVIYQMHEDVLEKRYKESVQIVLDELKKVIPHVELTGQWSVDVMRNGDDYYIIDMALAENSALNDCVPKNLLRSYPQQWLPQSPTM